MTMPIYKELMTFKRTEINTFMTNCYGEDGTEWDCKEDLISDIISFGHGAECLDYLKG